MYGIFYYLYRNVNLYICNFDRIIFVVYLNYYSKNGFKYINNLELFVFVFL